MQTTTALQPRHLPGKQQTKASRKNFKLYKTIRAKAHKEGTTFKQAMVELDITFITEKEYGVRHATGDHWLRNPRRTIDVRCQSGEIQGTRKIQATMKKIDDGAIQVVQDVDRRQLPSGYGVSESRGELKKRPMPAISLVDIARPAKAKAPGIAKEFELVQGVKKVIALDDDFEELDEDEWEQIQLAMPARDSYSAALRRNKG